MQISIQLHQYAPELSTVYLNGKQSRLRLNSLDVAQIAKASSYREKIAFVRSLFFAQKSKARGVFLIYEFKAGNHTHETRLLGTREIIVEKLKKAREGFDLYGVGYTVPQVTIKKIHSIF